MPAKKAGAGNGSRAARKNKTPKALTPRQAGHGDDAPSSSSSTAGSSDEIPSADTSATSVAPDDPAAPAQEQVQRVPRTARHALPDPAAAQQVREMVVAWAPARAVALAAYSNLVVIEGGLCAKLAGLPARRAPAQRRADQELNLGRRGNVESLLAHMTGRLALQQCSSCQKGYGPFKVCVVSDGNMCGSCANCWHNASGARCSFRRTPSRQKQQDDEDGDAPHDTVVVRVPAPTPVPGPGPVQPGAPTVPLHQPRAEEACMSLALAEPHTFAAPAEAGHLGHWPVAEAAGHLVAYGVSDGEQYSKTERYRARVEAAAKELGMRLSEYNDYLASAEGMAAQAEATQPALKLDGWMEWESSQDSIMS